MFKIVILQVIIAAAVAGPIYTGGMGYGGIGTSSVSVSRRTSVVSPGMYGGGMMTPGMGMYGTGMGLAALTDEKSAGTAGAAEEAVAEKKETTETVAEKNVEVETPVDQAVEVVKNINDQAPMGQMRTGVMGGLGVAPGMMGSSVAGSSRTDVVRAGLGGIQQSSVGQSHVATPFGSESSVSSVQRSSGVMV